jgi:hypothetical protein
MDFETKALCLQNSLQELGRKYDRLRCSRNGWMQAAMLLADAVLSGDRSKRSDAVAEVSLVAMREGWPEWAAPTCDDCGGVDMEFDTIERAACCHTCGAGYFGAEDVSAEEETMASREDRKNVNEDFGALFRTSLREAFANPIRTRVTD